MVNIKLSIGDSKAPVESPYVVKAVIVDDNGDVLLLKRGSTAPTFAGMWDLPGGHTHVGEDKLDGLYREVKEETNILINKSKTFPIAHKGNQTFYIVTKWNGVGGVKISFEHDEYEWIDLKTELGDYQCGPNYQKVLEYIAKLL